MPRPKKRIAGSVLLHMQRPGRVAHLAILQVKPGFRGKAVEIAGVGRNGKWVTNHVLDALGP